MPGTPLISIVTPSLNQGRFIRETLQSLIDQNYPNLEVIIQDGGSTDGSVDIAREFASRHPAVFKLFEERDSGQADALNRGFARTSGEIMGFLNSDDTLMPGCLARVAAEINPQTKRHIVFGRCLFTGEGSPYVGVEHPAEYSSHFEFLAIWKRCYNTIPQPSVFWHRTVWDKCGGFNEAESHVLDYDLFCRFSRSFRFHKVPELWSTYRMHPASKSSQRTETEILDMSIRTSRRHWGPVWSPQYWRLAGSHWLYDRHMYEHARHHARRAEEAASQGRYWGAFTESVAAAFHSPSMARDRLIRPFLSKTALGLVGRLFLREPSFTGVHGDKWVGPIYRALVEVPRNGTLLTLVLCHAPKGSFQRVRTVLKVNKKTVSSHTAESPGTFRMEADITEFRGRACAVELRCDNHFVPRALYDSPDDRMLSLQLLETLVETAPAAGGDA